jgi:two-component system sensor histidine kinase UhpB
VSRALDKEVSIHLYRVMQEALNNVARHSNSKCAVVRLRFSPDTVALEIEDEGTGFGNSGKQGLGLVSMRERAELMNGDIKYLQGPAGGALVRVTVPLAAEEAHA